MSRRPPPNPRPAVGSGVFKNLFEAKPEFPLKDSHPLRRLPRAAVGAPFSMEAVRSFELVATFDPYDLISETDKVLLNGGYLAAPQAEQGPSFLGQEMQDLLEQTLAEGKRLPPLADSAAVLRIRVRRITDTDARVGMSSVIKAYVEARIRPVLGEEVWSKIRYAYREVESTCSPILSEYAMMWCSTDQPSSDRFTDLIFNTPKPDYENYMEAFFRVLFGPLNTDVAIRDLSAEVTSYKSVVSSQTKWDLVRSFIRPVTMQNGRVLRQSTRAVDMFAARQFTAVPGQLASGQRQRRG